MQKMSGIVFTSCLLLMYVAISAYADGTHPQGIKLDGTIGNAGKLDLPGPDSLKNHICSDPSPGFWELRT